MSSMLNLLINVHSVVSDTYAKVLSQTEQTKSYVDALKKVKETTTSTNLNLNEQKPTRIDIMHSER